MACILESSVFIEQCSLDSSVCLVWLLSFNGISTFVGYLMSKPPFDKDSSGNI